MEPLISDPDFTLYQGDVIEVLNSLPPDLAHTVVTSPPYYQQRDYGVEGQIGLEDTLVEYLEKMVVVFAALRRVLRDDGTVWLNIGDGYAGNRSYQVPDNKHTNVGNHMRGKVPAGLKPKDLMMVPARLALALQEDGWYLRSEIIWAKQNPMPESIHDRPTCAHEKIFLLTKRPKYYYDKDAVKEEAEWVRWGYQSNPKYDGTRTKGGFIKERSKKAIYGFLNAEGHQAGLTRNLRNVWNVNTGGFNAQKEFGSEVDHYASYPEALVEPCIKAGSPEGGVVLDPFVGSGTSCVVARRLARKSIGIELKKEYAELCARRMQQQVLV